MNDARADSLDPEIETWLAAARAGDQRGYTGLYRLLAGRVAGYVRSRGVGDVDDVTNEVFLGAYRNLATFGGSATGFRSWLFGIAWNKSADWHRRAARHPPAVDNGRLERIAGGDAERESLLAIEAKEVELLLDGLTTDQRDVLLLRIVGDLSLEQTADALGKPISAVKSLQHRALATLRRNSSSLAVSPPGSAATTGAR